MSPEKLRTTKVFFPFQQERGEKWASQHPGRERSQDEGLGHTLALFLQEGLQGSSPTARLFPLSSPGRCAARLQQRCPLHSRDPS